MSLYQKGKKSFLIVIRFLFVTLKTMELCVGEKVLFGNNGNNTKYRFFIVNN